jgi:hypothetical protein
VKLLVITKDNASYELFTRILSKKNNIIDVDFATDLSNSNKYQAILGEDTADLTEIENINIPIIVLSNSLFLKQFNIIELKNLNELYSILHYLDEITSDIKQVQHNIKLDIKHTLNDRRISINFTKTANILKRIEELLTRHKISQRIIRQILVSIIELQSNLLTNTKSDFEIIFEFNATHLTLILPDKSLNFTQLEFCDNCFVNNEKIHLMWFV